MADFTIQVPYCGLVQVRISHDPFDDEWQALDAAIDRIDQIEPNLQFVDAQGSTIDEHELSIVEGHYTKNLVYLDGFQYRYYKIGWGTAPEPVGLSDGKSERSRPSDESLMFLQFDAGKSRSGTPQLCSVIYSGNGRILEVIDGEYRRDRRPQYQGLRFLGKFKTTVAEYRRLVKEFQRRE